MPKILPEQRIVNMVGFIKRQSHEMLHKLNQLESMPSDDVLTLTEDLCEQAEKTRAIICQYFDLHEGA